MPSAAEADSAKDFEAAAIFWWLLGNHKAAISNIVRVSNFPPLPPRTLARRAGKLELLRFAAEVLPPAAAAQIASERQQLFDSALSWALANATVGATGIFHSLPSVLYSIDGLYMLLNENWAAE